MKTESSFIAVIISVFLSVSLLAQEHTSLPYSVQGSVSDSRTLKRIESVHVSVPGRNHATVTNAEGSFTIKSDAPITSLTFTHMGYRTITVVPSSDGPLNVVMSAEAQPLEGATITIGNARNLVDEAVYRITRNYSSQPLLLQCFYRETVRKRQRYTYISEAVSKIYKTSYAHGVFQDRAALKKSRVLLSQKKSDTLSVKVMGGPTLAVVQDPVKNQDMLFNHQDMQYYRFETGNPILIDGRMQYVVNFHPGDVKPSYALYQGTLYIDAENLAFTRIELSLDMSDTVKATDMILVKKPLGLRFHPKELSSVVTYRRQEDGRYRLEYFRTSIGFSCDWKKRLFATNYHAVNELVVTDILDEAVPIPRAEMFKTTDILDDKAPDFFDPLFWEDYNIIEPTESLEHAIGHLRKR